MWFSTPKSVLVFPTSEYLQYTCRSAIFFFINHVLCNGITLWYNYSGCTSNHFPMSFLNFMNQGSFSPTIPNNSLLRFLLFTWSYTFSSACSSLILFTYFISALFITQISHPNYYRRTDIYLRLIKSLFFFFFNIDINNN